MYIGGTHFRVLNNNLDVKVLEFPFQEIKDVRGDNYCASLPRNGVQNS